MMARRALFAALAGACWLSWALPSRADEPEETRAEALFREGKAALAANDLKAACAKLEESERLEAAAGTLLNWADCEERSEHLAKALSLYEKARRMLPDDDFRIGFTDGRIQGLARRVPTLELVLRAAAPPDARVTLDGAPAPVGNAEPTDPGRHVAIVHAAGRADERFDVTLVEGDRRVVEIGPGAPVTTLVAASQPSAGGARTAGWILLGAGGVALAAGVVTGIMTIGAADTYKAHCHDGVCDPQGLDAASTGRVVSVVSPVAFGVGAAAAAVGFYLLLTHSSASSSSVAVSPAVGPGVASLGMRAAF